MKSITKTAAAAMAGGILGMPAAIHADSKSTLVALIAANATDPFNEILKSFEAKHPDADVKPEYAGTQILETQLEQGAPADIFLSADLAHIEKLDKEGLIFGYHMISKGHEVIVVPKGNPADIGSIRDLATKSNKLVIAAENVPIGAYTRQILAKAAATFGADFTSRVMANVVSLETNTKEVLAKVALGEADAGVVYKTDVTPGYADKVTVIEIPQQFEVEAANYIAVVKNSPNAKLAEDLVDYSLGPDGQAVFKKYGYDPI
jgi:molybdenum ABC transporter molybdate-binding protein